MTTDRSLFCSEPTLCHEFQRKRCNNDHAKPLGLRFRRALVAQGIEHRFPKPPGTSAVPLPGNTEIPRIPLTVTCELCAVTGPLVAVRTATIIRPSWIWAGDVQLPGSCLWRFSSELVGGFQAEHPDVSRGRLPVIARASVEERGVLDSRCFHATESLLHAEVSERDPGPVDVHPPRFTVG